jgi:hypothetical protein
MAEHFEMTKQMKTRLTASAFNAESEADRQLLMNVLIHSADISNPVLEFKLAKIWSDAVILEFNKQVADLFYCRYFVLLIIS